MKLASKLKITAALIVIVVILNWSTISDLWNNKEQIAEKIILDRIPFENSTEPEIYFCPQDSCEQELTAWLDAAKRSIHCALHELALEGIKEKLIEKSATIDVKLIVDNKYYDKVSDLDFAIHDNRSALMHNKFCVIDSVVVWTGSFNPTQRGAYHNNNNVVVYQSAYLARNFEKEFSEMWNGKFGGGDETEHPTVNINGKEISSYFCPEDWCANKLIYEIQNAKETIDFMTFSFTHDQVGRQLIERKNSGVEIRGVFEKSQNNAYTEKDKLAEAGIEVRWDGNKANMQHKVFIIDGETVVTGSFNPSNNADKNNDENLLIIHDPSVAELFAEEFERVWGAAGK